MPNSWAQATVMPMPDGAPRRHPPVENLNGLVDAVHPLVEPVKVDAVDPLAESVDGCG
jgi:hypothetical protein